MIITFCLLVFAIVCTVLLLKMASIADKPRKRVGSGTFKICAIVLAVFGIICVFLATCTIVSGDFQQDTDCLTVTIADKWYENGHYYFSDTNDNVYILTTNIWDPANYDSIPYKRYKDLVIGQEYQLEVYYVFGIRDSFGRCIKEEEIFSPKWGSMGANWDCETHDIVRLCYPKCIKGEG